MSLGINLTSARNWGEKITGDYDGRDRPGTGVYYRESVYILHHQPKHQHIIPPRFKARALLGHCAASHREQNAELSGKLAIFPMHFMDAERFSVPLR